MGVQGELYSLPRGGPPGARRVGAPGGPPEAGAIPSSFLFSGPWQFSLGFFLLLRFYFPVWWGLLFRVGFPEVVRSVGIFCFPLGVRTI